MATFLHKNKSTAPSVVVKLQKRFVDKETSPGFTSAWGWGDNDCVFIQWCDKTSILRVSSTEPSLSNKFSFVIKCFCLHPGRDVCSCVSRISENIYPGRVSRAQFHTCASVPSRHRRACLHTLRLSGSEVVQLAPDVEEETLPAPTSSHHNIYLSVWVVTHQEPLVSGPIVTIRPACQEWLPIVLSRCLPQFGWTHVTLLIVVTQSHLIIHNLFEGMIW